jgi:hypothetical protein
MTPVVDGELEGQSSWLVRATKFSSSWARRSKERKS